MIEWKEVSVYTGRNVVEDAPVNSVAGGGVDALHQQNQWRTALAAAGVF